MADSARKGSAKKVDPIRIKYKPMIIKANETTTLFDKFNKIALSY
jgi:hypothetical protein